MVIATQTQVPHGRSTAAAAPQVIPAFGDWESYYNGVDGGLPITQYFESARAAGLGRGRQQQQCPSFRKVLPHRQGQDHGHQVPQSLRNYHSQYCKQKKMMVTRATDGHGDPRWEKRPQTEEGPLMVRQQQLQRRRNNHCDYNQQPAVTTVPKKQVTVTGRTTRRHTPEAGKKKKKKKKKVVVRPAVHGALKAPVDEDLYKISPELLRRHRRATTKKRSILRAWRCMGIDCVV